jgi:hypothetical protein
MPLTERKLLANIQNARLSKGPVTVAGKAVSSKNSITHGLTAVDPVLPHEDRRAFENGVALQVRSGCSHACARRIAGSKWKLERLERLREAVSDIWMQRASAATSPDHEIAQWMLDRHADPLKVLDRYEAVLTKRRNTAPFITRPPQNRPTLCAALPLAA